MSMGSPSSSSCGSIDRKTFRSNDMLTPEEAGMHWDDQLLMYDSGGVKLALWLRVDGVEHPFDATGHFPVLAGYDTSGREIFVARAFFGDTNQPKFCYVCDGACSVSIVGKDGRGRTTSRFDVMVLRHDPCDVGVEVPEGAKFQTGPVFWMRKEKRHSFLKESESKTHSSFENRVSEFDSADSSSTDSEDGYEDELESTYPAPTHGFLEDLELDDLRIPVAELRAVARSGSITIELEKDGDAELPVDERGTELQHAYKVIEDQQRELEVQNRELEELRAFKSFRTGYDEDVMVRECKVQE